MVARRHWFFHRRLARGEQACEQEARLDLRARDRKPVADGVEIAALDGERRPAVVRLDARAHLRQRLDDPTHRPRAKRLVAGQLEAAALAGEQAGEETEQRARVRAVDRLRRRLEAAEPDAADAERVDVVLGDLGSERADGANRRLGVPRAPEAAHRRLALADPAEQDGAVRDRLVAGDGDVAGDRAGRLDERHCPSSAGATTTP